MTNAQAQMTNIDVVAGFIPAFLPVFASPDLSGRSNLGGDDEWTGDDAVGDKTRPYDWKS
jgi:hypothetical protein